MTTPETPNPDRDLIRRSTTTPRGINPYQGVPMPIPLEGYNLRAIDIFQERPLAHRLEKNTAWLQARPRTSDDIEAALFPEYSLCGMEHEEVRAQLNNALWDAGYTPDDHDAFNPTWTWTEGA